MDAEENLVLLPMELWSRVYLVLGPGVLSAATRVSPTQVAEIFSTPVLLKFLIQAQIRKISLVIWHGQHHQE